MAPAFYDAFISYSHKADGAFARQLQKALERYAAPWYRRRALRIFRDETTLKPTPALWGSIEQALNRSRYFILLASPEAAQSEWVNKEIAYWLAQTHDDGVAPAARLLIALTDGRLIWTPASNGVAAGFDPAPPSALPPSLAGAHTEEPLYVDFTWADLSERRTMVHKPFHDNVARLAAAIRGIALDDLIGTAVREHRRTMATAWGTSALVVALGVTAYFTWHQASVLTLEKQHQTDAERVLPQLEAQTQDLRRAPTRSVRIEFDPTSFFGGQAEILELRLELDPLFTVPMSFFFAPYVEGRTWPPEFKFTEPSHTEFHQDQARVDAKLVWFDRIETLSQSIDGTSAGTLPTFTLELDGQPFTPGTPGLHLAQTFEIPSLQALIDKKVRFRVLAHDPVAKRAREIDLATRPIDLRVIAHHSDAGTARTLVLFDGHPTSLQRAVLGGDYLVNRGPIEAAALLNFYPPVIAERGRAGLARREAQQRLVASRQPQDADERRLLARALRNTAGLADMRGDGAAASKGYGEVVDVLSPLVFDVKPQHADAESLFMATLQPIAYSVKKRQYASASAALPALMRVTDRLVAADAGEPDYLRWQGIAKLWTARIAAGQAAWPSARLALQGYVEAMREVDHRVGSADTRSDLGEALQAAARTARSWPSDAAVSALAVAWAAEATRLAPRPALPAATAGQAERASR